MTAETRERRPWGAAVVIAAGLLLGSAGGSFAAATINGNRIQTGALTSAHLADGSVTVRDLGPSAEARFRGPRGNDGPDGAVGPAGEKGPDGDAGLQGNTGAPGGEGSRGAGGVSGHAVTTTSATGGNEVEGTCATGKVILSANAYWSVSEFSPSLFIQDDRRALAVPVGGANNSDTLFLQIVCADAR